MICTRSFLGKYYNPGIYMCITRLQLGLISVSIYAHGDIGLCVLYNICVVAGFIHGGITITCNAPHAAGTYHITIFSFINLPIMINTNIVYYNVINACICTVVQISMQSIPKVFNIWLPYIDYIILVLRRMRVSKNCIHFFLPQKCLGYQGYIKDMSTHILYYSTELKCLARTKGVLRGVGDLNISPRIGVFLTYSDYG